MGWGADRPPLMSSLCTDAGGRRQAWQRGPQRTAASGFTKGLRERSCGSARQPRSNRTKPRARGVRQTPVVWAGIKLRCRSTVATRRRSLARRWSSAPLIVLCTELHGRGQFGRRARAGLLFHGDDRRWPGVHVCAQCETRGVNSQVLRNQKQRWPRCHVRRARVTDLQVGRACSPCAIAYRNARGHTSHINDCDLWGQVLHCHISELKGPAKVNRQGSFV